MAIRVRKRQPRLGAHDGTITSNLYAFSDRQCFNDAPLAHVYTICNLELIVVEDPTPDSHQLRPVKHGTTRLTPWSSFPEDVSHYPPQCDNTSP